MSKFLKSALIRCVRTMAQSALGIIGGAYLLSDVDWLLVGSSTVLAGILSLLTSIVAGLPEVEHE